MAEVKVTIKSEDKGSKNVQNFGQKLEGVLDIAQKSAVAVAAAGATFKKAFDLSREGANLNQLTASFDLMNEAVFKSPDLLNEMTRAAGGTIKQTDLMQGVLKLTAGASDELAAKMASAAPHLLEIARASNKLNPALGDTAFLYDSISTGIKRASPLILDNLGIVVKVGEANETYAASLGKTVDQLTAEEKQVALLNATMKAGDQLISQVGGNVDSQADSWARLSVQVEEGMDSFKRFLADGLSPVVSALAGDYGNAVDEAAKKTLAQVGSLDEAIIAMKRANDAYKTSQTFLGGFTGTEDEAADAIVNLTLKIAEQSDSYEDYKRALDQAGIKTYDLSKVTAVADGAMDLFHGTSEEIAWQMYDYAQSVANSSDEALRFANNTGEATMAVTQNDNELLNLTQSTYDYGAAAAAANERMAFQNALMNDTEDAAMRVEVAMGVLPPALDATKSAAGGAAIGIGGMTSQLTGATDAAGNLLTPLQEIMGAMDAISQREHYADAVQSFADNEQMAADKGVVLEEKLTGVYTKLSDTGTAADTSRSQVENYITRLGEIPEEVQTTLTLRYETVGAPGGYQGETGAAGYAPGSYGDKRDTGGSYEDSFDPFKNKGFPGYATGGIVPGPIGRPQMAIVHGGEQVLTPEQQAQGVGGVTINNLTINVGRGASPMAVQQSVTSGIMDAVGGLN